MLYPIARYHPLFARWFRFNLQRVKVDGLEATEEEQTIKLNKLSDQMKRAEHQQSMEQADYRVFYCCFYNVQKFEVCCKNSFKCTKSEAFEMV